MSIEVFEESNTNVKKYVFTKDDVVYEAVIYKYVEYTERIVICCSVMSGCSVGCTFCNIGKKFVRNLTTGEIVEQIIQVLKKEDIYDIVINNIKKFQIMFMGMGELMFNWKNVEEAIRILNSTFPEAQLLLSTVGIDNGVISSIIDLAKEIDKIDLQFSLHYGLEYKRNELIPATNKLSIRDIRDVGILFYEATGRKLYLNYCVTKDSGTIANIDRVLDIFSPIIFCFIFSIVCKVAEDVEDSTDYESLGELQSKFLSAGYDVRIFDNDYLKGEVYL